MRRDNQCHRSGSTLVVANSPISFADLSRNCSLVSSLRATPTMANSLDSRLSLARL